MKSFAFSDLNRRAGEVVDAALAAPVTLTKHGKPKLVVMSVAVFEMMKGRRAYTIDDAPEEINALLLSALDDLADK